MAGIPVAPPRANPGGVLSPTIFGVGLGLAGLSGTWTITAEHTGLPGAAADALWILTAAVFVINLVRFVARAGHPLRYPGHFGHPITGPFVALAPTTAMLLGDRLFADAPTAGRVIVIAAFAVAVVLGITFVHNILLGVGSIEQLHSGHLLPIVAAGFVGAQSLAVIGAPDTATAVFSAAVLAWLLIGAVLVARHAFWPPLPDALVPTITIFAAPPVVGGNAWFAISAPGSPDDRVQIALLGTGILLIGAQVMLIPRYRKLRFSLGFWSFTFTTAAAATYGIHWLALTSPPGATAWIWVLFAAATLIVGVIALRSLVLLRPRRSHEPEPSGAAEESS
jgi:tellurite resistance protein